MPTSGHFNHLKRNINPLQDPSFMHIAVYTIGSVVLVSVISVITAIPFLIRKKVSQKVLVALLSVSVGSLLGGAFIHLLPEMIEHGYTLDSALYLIGGFIIFFLLEKLVHFHHSKKEESDECGHGHGYHLAPINLIGDGIHNFIDGLVIAGAYVVNIPLGIAATISVIFHEIPQEVADFGILLYSGMTKLRAILFNLLSASTAIIGAIAGLIMSGQVHGFTDFIIPFAAGSFLYIAASNLVPELHRHCKLWDSLIHVLAIIVGVIIMILVTFIEVGHA